MLKKILTHVEPSAYRQSYSANTVRPVSSSRHRFNRPNTSDTRDEVNRSLYFVVELLSQISYQVPICMSGGGFQVFTNLHRGVGGQDASDTFEGVGFESDGGVVVCYQSGVKRIQAGSSGLLEFVEHHQGEVQVIQTLLAKLIDIDGRRAQQILEIVRGQFKDGV
jgi:hypothetical protein